MFLIFDTETTGLPKRDNAPLEELDNWPRMVQLAWQLHDLTGKLVESGNLIVQPDGYEIPYAAEKVHGISTERAKKEGQPLNEVLSTFAAVLEKTTVRIGHNIEFDIKVVGAEYLRTGIPNTFMQKPSLCTMRLSTDYCKISTGKGNKFKAPRLAELHDILFGESFGEAHNASADVNATARCFLELLRLKVIPFSQAGLTADQFAAFESGFSGPVPAARIELVSNFSNEQSETDKAEETTGKADLSQTPFCHLHVHTQYSILDGAASIPDLIRKAVDDGMKAIAITDHGNMFGAKVFHNEANKRGIKPIIGCEVYVARRSRHKKEDKNLDGNDHLILLAKNKTGYHNLMKLVSLGWTEGFYYKPRIDMELLEKYHEGLIASTACLGGVIPQAVMQQSVEAAEEILQEYKKLFGEDLYLELMRHRTDDPEMNRKVYDDQVFVNRILLELSGKHGIKVIATNDVHFTNPEDAEAHDHLICLNTGRDLEDPNRMRYTRQEWFKTQDEMRTVFADTPQALSNTMEIAEKIEEYELNTRPVMPFFPLPEGFTDEDDYLRHLTYKGAEKRYPELASETRERIDFELETIRRMGFPGYFLIVQDFIAAARDMGVSVGPGRGSAAGSAVAYCLGITDIDPIRYDLLFERFLNPDRISMPDIDIDFDEDGREDVLRWVVEKYGHDRVAHIITFGTMAAKMAIRDVARIQKLPLPEADRLAKLIPERPGTTLKKAYEEVEELRREKTSLNPVVVNTLQVAETLEGSVRQTGLHACGVIIGRNNLMEHLPVCNSKDSDLLVTQFDGKHVEDVGMLKMDFLGLKTLSIIKDAVQTIKESRGVDIDISAIPLDDKITFELYSRGDTTGLFQFESAGMKKYLKELMPNRFEDLIAMNALYRPGPMEYIPSFINRKHGKEPIRYDLPEMEEYLKDTYGITVYQEQVMLLSRKLAGFTRGQADTLRKAMGKKIRHMMDDIKIKFVEGCSKNGYDSKTVEKIWGDWEAFAQYAFNKSHSTCYAYVSYQTAYLKAHYPAEFMAAVLSRNITDIKKIGLFMDECRRMGISVLGPDVNESNVRFTVNRNGDIRFGLGAIKGVGEAAVQGLINERKKNGIYRDLYDFVERNDLSTVNRKTMEGLAISGGFDCFPDITRSQYIEIVENEPSFIEQLIKYGNKIQFERNTPQQNLFGEIHQATVTRPAPPDIPEWHLLDKINREKELIGIYLTAHPLDRFKAEISSFARHSLHDLTDLKALKGNELSFCGIVKTVRDTVDQWKNKPNLIAVLEDYSDTYTLRLKNDNYVNFKPYFMPGVAVLIKAQINEWAPPSEPGKVIYSLNIKQVHMLADVREKLVKAVKLELDLAAVSEQLIRDLQSFSITGKGKLLKFSILDPQQKVKVDLFSRNRQVEISDRFLEFLEEHPDITYKLV